MNTLLKPLWRLAAAVAALLPALLPAAAQARPQAPQGTPPGYDANCHCHRRVPYGSVSWFEPTTRRLTHQVMDIFLPGGTPPAGGWPVAYYGHANGATHFIAKDNIPGSKWQTLVQPLLDRGYVVVSYEFRHPVVNYVPGKPAPRYDIQRAIDTFATQYAATLGADPSNSFIFGRSRGAGLGLLTALTGQFSGGTQVRALWLAQAQTSFNCTEAANTFVLPDERNEFLAGCTSVPGAGSALKAVRNGAPPVAANYEAAFRKELVHAEEADVHFPDFGWQLCLRYAALGESGRCSPTDNVPPAQAWTGMADFFEAHRAR